MPSSADLVSMIKPCMTITATPQMTVGKASGLMLVRDKGTLWRRTMAGAELSSLSGVKLCHSIGGFSDSIIPI